MNFLVKSWQSLGFEQGKRLSWSAIWLVIIVEFLTTYALFLPIFSKFQMILNFVRPILMFVIIFWTLKLRPSDMALSKNKIKLGIVLFLVYWILSQLQTLAFGDIRDVHGKIIFNEDLQSFNKIINLSINSLIFLYFALFEEVVYRGVIFKQIYLKIFDKENKRSKAFWIALMSNSILFGLMHVPVIINTVSNWPVDTEIISHIGRFWAIAITLIGFIVISSPIFTLSYFMFNNLIFSWLDHGFGNAGITLFQEKSIDNLSLKGILYNIEQNLISIGVLLVLTIIFLFINYRKQAKNTPNLDQNTFV